MIFRNASDFMKFATEQKPIGKEEADALHKRAMAGDKKAYDDLVRRHLYIVVGIVLNLKGYKMDTYDLCSAGVMYMLENMKRYNGTKGTLSGFLNFCVRSDLLRYIWENKTMFAKSGDSGSSNYKLTRKIFYNLRRVYVECNQDFKKACAKMEIDEHIVHETYRELFSAPLSMYNEDDDLVFDIPYEQDMVEMVFTEQINERLEVFKKQLNDREIFILEERHLKPKCMSYKEIADKFGVSTQRVGQIENNVLGKVSNYFVDFRQDAC